MIKVDITYISVLLLLLILVINTFSYQRPTRFRYWGMPIYSLIMCMMSFSMSEQHLGVAILIVSLGFIIGYIQSHFAKFIVYTGESGEPRAKIRGGFVYLLGWILIFIIQGFTELLFNDFKGRFSWIGILETNTLQELLPFLRIQSNNLWVLWGLSASSNLSYTLALVHRSNEFQMSIKNHAHQKDVKARKIKK